MWVQANADTSWWIVRNWKHLCNWHTYQIRKLTGIPETLTSPFWSLTPIKCNHFPTFWNHRLILPVFELRVRKTKTYIKNDLILCLRLFVLDLSKKLLIFIIHSSMLLYRICTVWLYQTAFMHSIVEHWIVLSFQVLQIVLL